MRHSLLAAWCGLVLTPSLAFGDVLVVAPTGAPFSDVQTAINAAVDGDTILIKPGSYAGFTLDGKSLSIVSDVVGGASLLSLSIVQNIGVGQRVTISGLIYPAGAMYCNSSAGSLRFEAVETSFPVMPGFPDDGLWVVGCSDVAVLRSKLIGGPSFGAFPSNPGHGLRGDNSQLAVYDSILRGGKGSDGAYMGTGGSSYPALAGASGAWISGSTSLLASGCSFEGGPGGNGRPGTCFPGTISGGAGAPGGAGLNVQAGAQAYLLDSTTTGGTGGNGGSAAPSCGAPAGPSGSAGPSTAGAVALLPGPRGVLRCATHVREQNSLALTIEGQPGDSAWLRVGLSAQWVLDLPFKGVQLAGPATRRMFLGSIPTSGVLNTNVFYGDLGPGIESRTWHVQLFLRDSGGNPRYGSAAVIVVLDSAF